MSESKLFKELFCSVHVWTFFQKGGRLPNSKLFEELFCLCLEIFQGRGGGYLIPKLLRNFLACVWTFFRRDRGGLLDSKDDEEHFLV